MNVAGHIAVAQRLSDDPAFWLGAALPDLGSVGGFRLVGSTDHAAVTAGIRCHHATDDAFHRSEWFRSRQDRLRAVLADEGMARGAARAVAHVGPELLIDGALLRSDAFADSVAETFSTIIDIGDRLATLVPREPEAWWAHLRDIAGRRAPTDHDDPASVAARLERILSRRPRLAMAGRDVATATDALQSEHQGIRTTVAALLDHLETQVDAG